MTHDLNNAAWSDSHGAAHKPRRDRNTMKGSEDAKQGCSPTGMELSADCIDTNFQEYLNTMGLEMTHS